MVSRLLFNPITFILITAVSIIFSLSLYKSTQKTQQSSQELASMERDVSAMEKNVQSLEQTAQDAQQPFTKEKIIRDELLMQKPGEYVLQIPDSVEADQQQTTTQKPPTPWEEWKKLLF